MKLSPASPLFPIFTDYEAWLGKQPLSVHTCRAYRTQVGVRPAKEQESDIEHNVGRWVTNEP